MVCCVWYVAKPLRFLNVFFFLLLLPPSLPPSLPPPPSLSLAQCPGEGGNRRRQTLRRGHRAQTFKRPLYGDFISKYIRALTFENFYTALTNTLPGSRSRSLASRRRYARAHTHTPTHPPPTHTRIVPDHWPVMYNNDVGKRFMK
jgi:hypothetical protein